jgi:hypothetical protein
MRLLDEILDGFAPEATVKVEVGSRWVEKDSETDKGKKIRTKEPIFIEFKTLKDATEIETLQQRAQAFVSEQVELKNRNGLSPKMAEVFPKGKSGLRTLAKAFAMAFLSVDPECNEVFWLKLAKHGGPDLRLDR